ncbi:hypothetical protein SAMN04488085_10934 [Geodermatophilus ruber]|uniref:Uncharacterized protein n=2 Tax=Geodermatophilus ruber TaxID=504800 RepID=A0A1I4GIY4_9ACTN|nr:hypothetical protein SAMN04488085_10934 [Geodermatophilus ruber]
MLEEGVADTASQPVQLRGEHAATHQLGTPPAGQAPGVRRVLGRGPVVVGRDDDVHRASPLAVRLHVRALDGLARQGTETFSGLLESPFGVDRP